jgi:hypothetical protein
MRFLANENFPLDAVEALRQNGHDVVWIKVEFKDTARLLTVIQTCRAQGRSVLKFLREALVSVAHKLDNLVSLIPSSDDSLVVNPSTIILPIF